MSQSPSGGLSLHFAAAILLVPISGILLLAGQELPWPFLAGGVAAAVGFLWLSAYCLRRDPWTSAMAGVPMGMCFGGIASLVVMLRPTPVSVTVSAVGWFVVLASAVYIVWRRFGRESVPDILGDDEVLEIDGIQLRLKCPEPTVALGDAGWISLELQNVLNAPVEVTVGLAAHAGRLGATATRVVQVLEAAEVGTLWIPVRPLSPVAGPFEVRLRVRARRQKLFSARVRLRAKPVVPVGPLWVMSLAGALTGKLKTYAPLAVEFALVQHSGAPSAGGEVAQWKSQWTPSDAR